MGKGGKPHESSTTPVSTVTGEVDSGKRSGLHSVDKNTYRLLQPAEAAYTLGVEETTLSNWRSQRRGPDWVKVEGLVKYTPEAIHEYIHRRTISSRNRYDRPVPEKRQVVLEGQGHGIEKSGDTGLDALPENALLAAYRRKEELQRLRSKPDEPAPVKQTKVSVEYAVEKFVDWYRSQHPRGGACKWAVSLMRNSQIFFTEFAKVPLTKITPGTLEDFKVWRATDDLYGVDSSNTVRKQLLLLAKFFRYCRKQGWMVSDPFVAGPEDRVEIPAEEESDDIYVLSPEDERDYLAAALTISTDLHDLTKIMGY